MLVSYYFQVSGLGTQIQARGWHSNRVVDGILIDREMAMVSGRGANFYGCTYDIMYTRIDCCMYRFMYILEAWGKSTIGKSYPVVPCVACVRACVRSGLVA